MDNLKISYTFLKILTGSDLSKRKLAFMQMESPVSGPVIWLTGAVHGDEVGGIVVIQEIFKKIKRTGLNKGAIYAFPLMNPIAFESATSSIPISNEDLNRAFPGNPYGGLAERIADMIFQKIISTKPALVLDLHNDWIKSIPYCLIDPYPGDKYKEAYETSLHFAKETGFLVVNEEEEDYATKEELKKTLSGSLINNGVASLTLELGQAYIVNENHIQEGVESIWNLLIGLEMVPPIKERCPFVHPTAFEFKDKIFRYSHKPASSSSGIVRFLIDPGSIVRKDQPVAKIYNVFGKVREVIKAGGEAVVLGLNDSAVSYPGVAIAAFGLI